ncbi:hypothetical protein RRG08_028402 [Elysia crispata]|uniref:Uncharacterized protein n=1 Tax=Elysia crispata TaxID=231223 RepID=A0AAE0Y394_9GAST|nr:hypothetical protein RRG08_028402 [Elysia crispata]
MTLVLSAGPQRQGVYSLIAFIKQFRQHRFKATGLCGCRPRTIDLKLELWLTLWLTLWLELWPELWLELARTVASFDLCHRGTRWNLKSRPVEILVRRSSPRPNLNVNLGIMCRELPFFLVPRFLGNRI